MRRIGTHEIEFAVQGRTRVRNEAGRFVAATEAGASAASLELAKTLADLVRGAIAANIKSRTGELLGSVEAQRISGAEAAAIVGAGHAAPLETGSVDHWIPGAFGRVEGVFWRGRPGRGGRPGFRYIEEAERALKEIALAIVRRNMP